MKKILFVALGATLFAAGCQKTEIINPVNPNGTPAMTFSTGISKLTKSATASGTENLQTQGFVLSAVGAYEDVNSDKKEFNSYYDVLENKKFNYVPESEEFVIETKDSYFWPGKDRNLVFFAVSSGQVDESDKPVNVVPTIAEGGFGLTGTEGEEGIYTGVAVQKYVIEGYKVIAPTYNQTEGATYGDQTGADDDLMVADVVMKNQDSVSDKTGQKGQVDLAFNHTLSKVEFVFSTNAQTATIYPVVLDSVVVNKVVKTADLTIGVEFDDKGTSNNVYDWDAANADATYATAAAGNSEPYTINYDLDLTAAEQTYATWLVIPQDLAEKTVTITYTILDAQNPDAQPKTFTSVWPLSSESLNLNAWGINQYVKYKVNLSPNLITFNPYLENDWNTHAFEVDPSTGAAATAVTYTSITVGGNSYYFVGTTLAKGLQVFELVEAKYVLTTVTSIETDACTYTLANGVVTEIVEKTPTQE